jgi:hypothetical protein
MPETPKGLTTVAFLKARLDENLDHLGLFEPLVADALQHMASDDFGGSEVRDVLCERTGILVPVNTLQTVLGRFVNRDMLRRHGGRYFRTTRPVPDPNLEAARATIASDQLRLGAELRQMAVEQDVHFDADEDALAALAAFISDNKVQLMLQEPLPDSPLDRSSQTRKATRTIARFITERCLQSEALRPILDGLVEGMIIEDALLLRDIQQASLLFHGLTVVLDTPVLFPSIGMSGTATAVAVSEGLNLLRAAGAKTVAFDTTIEEMRRILSVFEDKVATSAGKTTLYPTDLARYVLRNKLTPGDIRLISSTLEARLKNKGVVVQPLPKRDQSGAYTLDEAALAKCLVDQRAPDLDAPRIRHDVDCIAGVLTLRRGRISNAIERSVAVFISTSGRVVRNAQQWYLSQNAGGMPPIIHHLALTSIAWLKKPAAAPSVKVHELAAICTAALRPTRETWTRALSTLRDLSKDGLITSDESVAIVVSELIEPTLARIDEDTDPDADSIHDAIERVRESYRHEASVEADQKVAAVYAQMEETRRAADESVARAESEARIARDAASDAIASSDSLRSGVEARLRKRASRIANGIVWILAILLVTAAILSVPGVFDAVGATTKVVARVIIAIGAIFGLYGAFKGGSLSHLRASIAERLAKRFLSEWLDSAPKHDGDTQ